MSESQSKETRHDPTFPVFLLRPPEMNSALCVSFVVLIPFSITWQKTNINFNSLSSEICRSPTKVKFWALSRQTITSVFHIFPPRVMAIQDKCPVKMTLFFPWVCFVFVLPRTVSFIARHETQNLFCVDLEWLKKLTLCG